MHYYTDIITHGRPFLTSRRHWWEQVSNTVIEFHPSITNGSCRAWTRIARLIDRDANNCAISLPHHDETISSWCPLVFLVRYYWPNKQKVLPLRIQVLLNSMYYFSAQLLKLKHSLWQLLTNDNMWNNVMQSVSWQPCLVESRGMRWNKNLHNKQRNGNDNVEGPNSWFSDYICYNNCSLKPCWFTGMRPWYPRKQ